MLTRIIITLLLCGLVGCGSNSRAPVEDRHGKGQSAVSVYVVQSGDTLYSIAFRYGLDYRKVAEVNSIPDPYTIYPGQDIYLWQTGPSPVYVAPARATTPAAATSGVAVAPAVTGAAVAAGAAATGAASTAAGSTAAGSTAAGSTAAGSTGVIVTAVPGIASAPVTQVATPPTPVYRAPAQPTPGVYHPSTGPARAPAKAVPPVTSTAEGSHSAAAPVTKSAAPATQVSPAAATVARAPVPAPAPSRAAPPARAPTPGAKVTAWRWPASGKVSRGYSTSVHKGIDIAGNRGDPIYAVADGTVVYAGTGIVGFGELVIIKHNDIYISAYGHNDRLLVRENEVVGAGQIIAEKGSSGTDTVKLHFEIRKEGKPVDPVKLLPRR